MSLRYLEADKVELPKRAPLFVEEGRCQWCNRPLTGKATRYCVKADGSAYSNVSDCAAYFFDYWFSRPAYIRAVFIRDNFTCQKCGYHEMLPERPWLPDLSNLECDHIIPLARGGETSIDNLQTLCKACNRKKGTSIEGLQELPSVVPSRDNGRCPRCGAKGYRILSWRPPVYYDPLMIKVECLSCRQPSYIAPRLSKARRK